MFKGKNEKAYHCPVEAALDVIGGKWKSAIIWHLGEGTLRYNEIQKELPNINAKMLTKQLRELEEDGILKRTVYPEVPPHVEYCLTDFGKTLLPLMDSLCAWGATYLDIGGESPASPGSSCPQMHRPR